MAFLSMAMLATPLIGTVYAKQPTFVSGDQMITAFTPVDDVPIGNSDNHISTATLEVMWSGDITGLATYTGTMMVHSEPVPMNIHEKIYFETVTVLGKSGSLTLEVNANLGRGQDVFRWTIINGTDELANLHGNGIYYLDEVPFYLYEGQVHFDP
jgi:hypothetical protein